MIRWLAAVMVALAACPPSDAAAQGLSGSLASLSVDSSAPIHIESDSLELDEKKSIATFIGRVRASQDDMVMTSERLLISYRGAKGGQPATLQYIEARGSVVVRVRDQVATGDVANYDLGKEEVALSGNVVLSQGDNVIRGDRIIVDLKTNRARMVSGESGSGQRVRGVFTPNRSR